VIAWTLKNQEIIEKYAGKPLKTYFPVLPGELKRYKCHTCKTILHQKDTVERVIQEKQGPWTVDKTIKACPECGGEIVEMCPLDHCNCSHEILETITYCPLCSAPICPECGSHDVVQISRVTGYLQEVGGWNAGKQQELKDRTRYDVLTGEIVEKPAAFIPKTIRPASNPPPFQKITKPAPAQDWATLIPGAA